MTNILNLDEVETGNEKSIVLKKKTHKMASLTVKDYIDQLKAQDKVADPATSFEDQFTLVLDAILRAFPTVKRTDLETLEFPKLNALFDFIRGVTAEETARGNAQ